ncbi:MAG TPA: bifunctional precorrin-2 dehydrogenase/sirohydrochlorin ferrochelatase [Actinobacteria bacterium]|nr:siroheme synthase [bacterium BMS3Bbin01]HDH25364.1 bifunctional precorrin-2 dehydrogenase/sirohydrochlorin ferrochelatase [Actinomycetota bacterium]
MTVPHTRTQPTERSPAHYPLLLRLEGRSCVVVGGGKVAEGKVEGLVAAGGDVTVVSPELTERLLAWFEEGRIDWNPRPYQKGDLAGRFLAIAATEQRDVNEKVWQEAQEHSILLNAPDDPPHCNFILPAVHRQGDLVVAVSSGGRAPAFSVWLRDRIAQGIGPEYGAYLDLLGELRPQVADRFTDPTERRRAWQRLIDGETFEHVRRGDTGAAHRTALESIDTEEEL